MQAYSQGTQEFLRLSDEEWVKLVDFIEDVRPRIEKARESSGIESPPPQIIDYNQSSRSPKFAPHGWVGRYPGGVNVVPDKINHWEYRYLRDEIAGWLELWDVPTAAAVMPLLYSGVEEQRSFLLGYSQALIAFTEEAVSNRPPVTVERKKEASTQPQGPLDIQRTISERAQGSQKLSYNRLQFSFDNRFNQLLVRFHAELAKELSGLARESVILTPYLREHQKYHEQFIESRFSDGMLDTSLKIDFTDPSVLSEARSQVSSTLVELIDIWESYVRNQALSVDFDHQLNVGIKPIEKIYELWILKTILQLIEEITGYSPSSETENLERFTFEGNIDVFYNTSLPEHSRFLAGGLNSNPGRPDFAVAVDEEIRWIGDAKFSPLQNVRLEDYQRLLSYAVDLMPSDVSPTASVIYVDTDGHLDEIDTNDYRVSQFPVRPKSQEEQLWVLQSALEATIES